MPDLKDGESVEMKGSGAKPYTLKNVGGVYSCTCPAWRNQSLGIERRTCKHLRALRGDAAEEARIGAAVPRQPAAAAGAKPTAPPLLLAERWQMDVDLVGWWMSEKLDGVRAYWDGKVFISRLGNQILAPDWFAAGLPDVPLDGELWMARKKFNETSGIVRRQDRSDHWRGIRFLVFDAPGLDGEFEKRLAFVADFIKHKQPPFALAHEQQQCKGIDHLHAELRRIEELGGEGLMLRQPGSRYEVGRSCTLLKVKTFLDAEARVVKHLPGAGRHKGRLGALLVELGNGTQFSVGTGFSDAERERPPAIGTVITFRYQELSEAGVPRFPSYVSVRRDLTVSAPPPPPPASAAPVPEPVRPTATVSVPATPPPAAAPPPPASSGAAAAKLRRFEFVAGSSNKFWEIEVNGNELTTRWGRIGGPPQRKTKTFKDAATAAAEAAKLIAQKTGKGYVEK
jgi:DNA ligase 1